MISWQSRALLVMLDPVQNFHGRRAGALAAFFLLGLSLTARAAAPYATNQSAILPVGQPNLSFNGINGTPGVAAAGLSSPGAAWSNGSMLIVADTSNHRVLIYNTLPAANGAAADVILGQPDATSNSANQGGAPGASTLSSPSGVFFDGVNLYIADRGNNRVLIFNTVPVDNNTPADTVVGQTSMTSGAANQGAAASSGTLSAPNAVYSDGTALYIADRGNNRVLIYNAIPGLGVNGTFANVVVGQANGTATAANQGGLPNAKTLSGPTGVYATAGKLLISDQNNNRVLIYNAIPAVSNSSADAVVGQVLLTSAAANQGGAAGANTLSAPAGVYSDGVKLIVPDSNNNRVLIYNTIPAVNNSPANVVVGQTVMTAGAANQGKGAPAAGTLSRPAGAVSDGANLYVADQNNNRVLLYNPTPATNGASASQVQGQSTMTTGVANQAAGTPGANTLSRPAAMALDSSGTKLLVADRFNNRVLIFNSLPSAANASADVVIGQVLMSSANSNQGGAVAAANTLSFPASARAAGAKLIVTDQSNNRVLIYNALPAVNNSSANVVVGQPTLVGRSPNQGGLSASSLFLPADAASDGTRLFVADRINSRVLIYNAIPAANGAAANVVVGQVFMSSGASNQGGLANAKTLSLPSGVFSDGAKLFIADQNNNRVLIYNAIPAINNAPADVVVGQPNMVSSATNQGGAPAANTLSRPASVYSDGTALYIADQGNNRVLIYKTIPAANNAAADIVLGQAALNAGGSNAGGAAAANTLFAPNSVFTDSTTGRLFIADGNNNRILLDLPAISATLGAAGGGLTLNTPTEPVSAVLQASAGALAQPAYAILGAAAAFPVAPSPAGALKASGIGAQITLSPSLQPAGSVTLTVAYNPADVAALDRSKLILARYDASAGVWVPLPSASDAANNQVIAQVDHFTLYQIMQVDPSGNSLATFKAFPNPLEPAAGQTTMTFSQLPPNSRLRVYTLSGVLIKDLTADVTGIARWDATNQSGLKVASGVYFVYLQGAGDKRAVKVVVQR